MDWDFSHSRMERTCRFGHYDCLNRIEATEVEQALLDLGALPPRG